MKEGGLVTLAILLVFCSGYSVDPKNHFYLNTSYA